MDCRASLAKTLVTHYIFHMHDSTKATLMRTILAICIGISIGMMYYVNIVEKDYKVFTSENGPEGLPN